MGNVCAHVSDSSLIELPGRQSRSKINAHSDISGVQRFACSSINNVTQTPRHCRTNDGHVLVVARVTLRVFLWAIVLHGNACQKTATMPRIEYHSLP